jgi:hypothetical protein
MKKSQRFQSVVRAANQVPFRPMLTGGEPGLRDREPGRRMGMLPDNNRSNFDKG